MPASSTSTPSCFTPSRRNSLRAAREHQTTPTFPKEIRALSPRCTQRKSETRRDESVASDGSSESCSKTRGTTSVQPLVCLGGPYRALLSDPCLIDCYSSVLTLPFLLAARNSNIIRRVSRWASKPGVRPALRQHPARHGCDDLPNAIIHRHHQLDSFRAPPTQLAH